MQLAQYMAERKLTDQQVAEAVGLARSTITRLRLGNRKPSWDVAERIRQWSAGAVTPNDWAEQTEAAE